MKKVSRVALLSAFPLLGCLLLVGHAVAPPETSPGWSKSNLNPVVSQRLGTMFDASVLKVNGKYRMWASWRSKRSIVLMESVDGEHWGDPTVVLEPAKTGWEEDVNRPGVVLRSDGYHMWYTGQTGSRSAIGYAVSSDGVNWTRKSARPVLTPDASWEQVATMCPQVLWDENERVFRMWYSAGAQYEPDAIGHATSRDGLLWVKDKKNPVFRPDPSSNWDNHKVAGGQVIKHDGWFYMFYIGFRNVHHAQIGMARSRDGLREWHRYAQNPVIRTGLLSWDTSACYKPAVLYDQDTNRWMLWYNGRRWKYEHIGFASHMGASLNFK